LIRKIQRVIDTGENKKSELPPGNSLFCFWLS